MTRTRCKNDGRFHATSDGVGKCIHDLVKKGATLQTRAGWKGGGR